MRRRDWSDTHAKAAANIRCVVCGRSDQLERAHTIGRSRDAQTVNPDDVVWLCGPTPTGCHGRYDSHELDLYPYLTDAERIAAVRSAGGPGLALRRLMGRRWRSPDAGNTIDSRLARLEDLCTEPTS